VIPIIDQWSIIEQWDLKTDFLMLLRKEKKWFRAENFRMVDIGIKA